MSNSCPNCDKPILESDTVCWHCGFVLPKRPKPRATAEPANRVASLHLPARERQPAESVPVAYDFRALAIYGLLTLAVILSLWMVMRSLSRQPILVRSAALDLGGNWVSVTDVDLVYTLTLPSDWQWLDVGYRDQSELLTKVFDRQPYMARALRPLGEGAGDVETLSVAVGTQVLETTDPQPFVIVARSERLGEMSPETALELLGNSSLPVSEQSVDTHLAGQPQARFNILDMPNAYQCRHLFVTAESKPAYLVAACAPQSRFGTMQRDLNTVLNSFQLLER